MFYIYIYITYSYIHIHPLFRPELSGLLDAGLGRIHHGVATPPSGVRRDDGISGTAVLRTLAKSWLDYIHNGMMMYL